MKAGEDGLEQVYVASRDQLRDWLEQHHAQKESIWLITYKKGGERYLPYDAIVEEALCFGWVDSQPRTLDRERSMRRLSPRDPNSSWSKKNREHVARLEAAGLMRAAGRRVVAAAKRSGAWDRMKDAENLKVPGDLARALREHEARNTFDGFPPSSRRIILEWIETAKKPETRTRRIEETAQKAARGVKANHYRQ